MIVVDHVVKRFGAVVAVNGVSFTAEAGKVTGLVGPNGAGKTTTMRMLSTLVRPDSGRVSIDGIDVAADPMAARQKLGVLTDGRGLYPRLTAAENIRYHGELHGIDAKAIDERIAKLAALLQMESVLHRRTEGFSQGERMKVALGRALIHGPPNVLLDEPTNGLDVATARAVRTLVRALRDEGKAVLFSSHVMQDVALLCDHIVIVSEGRVIVQGSAEALMEQTNKTSLEEAFLAAVGLEQP